MSFKILDENDLPYELLLTTRQKNVFNNNMSTALKLSKSQKIIQSGGLLGSLLSKLASPLMKVAVPLVKNILVPLGITASAIDAEIQKKIHGSGAAILVIPSKKNERRYED